MTTPPRLRTKLVKGAVAFGLLVLLAIYALQREVLYMSSSFFFDPEFWGVPRMKVVSFPTRDGLRLAGWYAPAAEGLPTIVYFPGLRAHLGFGSLRAHSFLDAGYGFLMLAYRGYAINSGRPSERGLYRDARAAIRFLADEGVLTERMVFYGYSLGTAVATQMATEFIDVAGVVLEAPFRSSTAMVRRYAPFTPNFLIRDKFETLAKIGSVRAPLLILHGSEDRTAPVHHALALYQRARSAILRIIEGAGHGDVFRLGGDEIVLQFVRGLPAVQGVAGRASFRSPRHRVRNEDKAARPRGVAALRRPSHSPRAVGAENGDLPMRRIAPYAVTGHGGTGAVSGRGLWQHDTQLPRYSIAYDGAAERLGVMLREAVSRQDIETVLSALLDDIEARIAEEKAMGGPPLGSA